MYGWCMAIEDGLQNKCSIDVNGVLFLSTLHQVILGQRALMHPFSGDVRLSGLSQSYIFHHISTMDDSTDLAVQHKCAVMTAVLIMTDGI